MVVGESLCFAVGEVVGFSVGLNADKSMQPYSGPKISQSSVVSQHCCLFSASVKSFPQKEVQLISVGVSVWPSVSHGTGFCVGLAVAVGDLVVRPQL
jgi:hypothetical protein